MLTIEQLKRGFVNINNKHFGGSLVMPEIQICHTRRMLGQFCRIGYRRYVIKISDYFNRCEGDLLNTLAHEMIHQYIFQNGLKDYPVYHGRLFNQIADRLNREGGFHIARTDSVDGMGIRNNGTPKKFLVGVAHFKAKDIYIRFVISASKLEYFKEYLDCDWADNLFIFESTDDKTYAHYPECRSRARGYEISKQDYDTLKKTENVIYQTITLSVHPERL